MSDTLDWNAKTIAEFRANEGRVGGNFEGAPMVLLHHRGRKSGREYVNPMMYLPHDTEPDIIYVFATKGGAPTNPDWYHNLTAAGVGIVERGTETYKVTVRELTGAERDRIYAEQARRYPGFAEYARQTAGVRSIPVLELEAGVVHTPKTGQRGAGDVRGIHPPHRLVAHRRPAAHTPDARQAASTMRELEGAQALLEAEEAVDDPLPMARSPLAGKARLAWAIACWNRCSRSQPVTDAVDTAADVGTRAPTHSCLANHPPRLGYDAPVTTKEFKDANAQC